MGGPNRTDQEKINDVPPLLLHRARARPTRATIASGTPAAAPARRLRGRADLAETQYNADFRLTEEVVGILRLVFDEFGPDEASGAVSVAHMLATLRRNGGLSDEELARVARVLDDSGDAYSFEGFCQLVLDVRAADPALVARLYESWLAGQLRESVIVEEAHAMQRLPTPPAFWTAAKSLVAGGCAGVVAKSAVAPFDRVKILAQVSHKPFTLRGLAGEAAHILETEGWRAFWKGNLATVTRVFPYAGIQLMSYDAYKGLIMREDQTQISLTPGQRIAAGSLAGATSVLFTYPLDVLRARLAVARGAHFESLGEAARRMHRDGGARAFVRGIGPTLLGILPYAGVAFACNEELKQRLGRRIDSPLGVKLASGGLAGLVAQSITYPLDVARRRLQTMAIRPGEPPPPFMLVLRDVHAAEGVRGLFKGLSLNWFKSPVALSISFTVFDLLKERFGVSS